MNEQDLRALIRDTVARHLGGSAPAAVSGSTPRPPAGPVAVQHASHALYLTLSGGGDACLIEPAVPCNHCAYCQSHGH